MTYSPSIPLAPVTVNEVKAHLRIDDDSEDVLIEQYIMVATQQAEHVLQREIIYRNDEQALCNSIDEVPPTVKQYLLCYVGDLYAHRELSDEQNLKTFYVHLLDPYILYNRMDD